MTLDWDQCLWTAWGKQPPWQEQLLGYFNPYWPRPPLEQEPQQPCVLGRSPWEWAFTSSLPHRQLISLQGSPSEHLYPATSWHWDAAVT